VKKELEFQVLFLFENKSKREHNKRNKENIKERLKT